LLGSSGPSSQIHTNGQNQRGFSYYFQDVTEAGTPTNRGYVSVSVPQSPKGSVLILVHDRAIEVTGQEWSKISQRWPTNLTRKKGHSEIKVASAQDWKLIEPDMRELCKAILAGRQILQEKKSAAERRNAEEHLKDAKES
jgi:hypothetical protein